MYYKSTPEAVSPQVFATSFQSRVMWVAGGSVGGLLYIQPRPIYARGGLPIISISFPRTPALKGFTPESSFDHRDLSTHLSLLYPFDLSPVFNKAYVPSHRLLFTIDPGVINGAHSHLRRLS